MNEVNQLRVIVSGLALISRLLGSCLQIAEDDIQRQVPSSISAQEGENE